MWVVVALAVGSVGLVITGFAWVARRDERVEVERIGRLALLTLKDLAPGELGAARGTVAGPAEHEDPVTGQDAVFFEARVRRRDRDEVLYEDEARGVLRLSDDSGRDARIELIGAEIDIPVKDHEESDKTPSPKMVDLLGEEGVSTPPKSATARYSLEHRAIEVGDELTVVGVPKLDDGTLRFGGPEPLYLIPGELSELQARLRADLAAMDRMLLLGAVIAGASFLGGLLLALLG